MHEPLPIIHNLKFISLLDLHSLFLVIITTRLEHIKILLNLLAFDHSLLHSAYVVIVILLPFLFIKHLVLADYALVNKSVSAYWNWSMLTVQLKRVLIINLRTNRRLELLLVNENLLLRVGGLELVCSPKELTVHI